MQLVIKDGVVIATHADHQKIEGLYGDAEIIHVPDGIILEVPEPAIGEGEESISFAPTLPADPRLKWSLDQNRAAALETIEDQSEAYRERFVTAKAGRIASYRAKARIAERIRAAEQADEIDVQALTLEAEARGLSVEELARLILDRARRFESLAALIDGLAAQAKAAVRAADSPRVVWSTVAELRRRAEASFAEFPE